MLYNMFLTFNINHHGWWWLLAKGQWAPPGMMRCYTSSIYLCEMCSMDFVRSNSARMMANNTFNSVRITSGFMGSAF